MGYPFELQVLVIEDEQGSKTFYDAVFEKLAGQGYDLAPLRYAFCHEDGVRALGANTIYHLVILDLRLPRCPDEPPAEGLDFGLDLLNRCAERNEYPIPALLVISGHLDKADQGDLHARVTSGFAHGQVLFKGGNLEADIRTALDRCLRYCQVSVHLRDGGIALFPTLTPRDKDLLRRAVIAEGCCIGLDIGWWSAEFTPPIRGDARYSGWTKTLMGAFLLDKGRGKSRPTFFKLAPNAGAESVAAEAKLLQHKLSHIKVFPPVIAGNRSLLITQKVGDDDGPPVALADFLGRKAGEAQPHIAKVVREVATQVRQLGDYSPNQLPVPKLLWPDHNLDTLNAQWERWRGRDFAEQHGPEYDAVAQYKKLLHSRNPLRVGSQSALHGDLSPSNVALDVRTDDVRGYIFDASGVAPGPNFRDLAMLEVTSLLHLPLGLSENLVTSCAKLYETAEILVDPTPPPDLSDRASNTWTLIAEIRRCAMDCPDVSKFVYAITVFDHSLIQLGGLAFAVSHNKIRDPEQAAALAGRIAHWIELISPAPA
jgi:CheY-like chemotaxis protein